MMISDLEFSQNKTLIKSNKKNSGLKKFTKNITTFLYFMNEIRKDVWTLHL